MQPFATLATLNSSIIFGLLLLLVLSVGHITQRFRLTQREEYAVIGLFALFILLSILDRALASQISRFAMAGEPLVSWGRAAVVVRVLFGVNVWVFALYVLGWIWGRRLGQLPLAERNPKS